MTEEERYEKFKNLSLKLLNNNQRQIIIDKIFRMERIEKINTFTSDIAI